MTKTGYRGTDFSMGPAKETGVTSMGKYPESGPHTDVFDLPRGVFGFSKDEFEFNNATNGVSKEFILNQVGQTLQGFFERV